MRARGAGFFLELLLLCICSTAIARAADNVSVEVDARIPGARLRQVWAYFGYDEVNYTTAPESMDLLRTLGSLHDDAVHIRTHFLFNTGDGTSALKWGSTNLYTEDALGTPTYDFSTIDQIMDAKIAAGVLPLFELGFMPKALSTQPEPYENSGVFVLDGGAFFPPKDYRAWAELVSTWAEHVKERYADSQGNWLWELWNEPDINYWHGTIEEYNRLYDFTEAALHSVLPEAPLGGPAVADPQGTFLTDFLEHCANGTNTLTGQRGTRLDRVTFHAKGGVTRVDDHVQLDLGSQLKLHRAGFQAVANSAFASTPIIISEADPDGCAACPSSRFRHLDYRNSPAYGAYEAAMMKHSLELAAESGVELHGVLTWAFTFPGTPYFAGYRALATNGIHLPVLNVFKLLASLRGNRVPATSSRSRPLSELLETGVREEPEVDALAAISGNTIRILVWHYHDDLVPGESATVQLSVAVNEAFADGAVVAHQRVDTAHGDAYTAWRDLGSPSSPSEVELASLRSAMNSLALEPERVADARDGTVTLSFELPRFGVSLVTLSPARERGPAERADSGCSCGFSGQRLASTAYLVLFGLFFVARLSRRRGQRRFATLAGCRCSSSPTSRSRPLRSASGSSTCAICGGTAMKFPLS